MEMRLKAPSSSENVLRSFTPDECISSFCGCEIVEKMPNDKQFHPIVRISTEPLLCVVQYRDTMSWKGQRFEEDNLAVVCERINSQLLWALLLFY